MECSINNPAPSLLMKHLVICQRKKNSLFLGFSLVTTGKSGFHWSAFRNHEGSAFTEKGRNKLNYRIGRNGPNHQVLQLCTAGTAWSDSDQAVRAVHSCNSWFLAHMCILYIDMLP